MKFLRPSPNTTLSSSTSISNIAEWTPAFYFAVSLLCITTYRHTMTEMKSKIIPHTTKPPAIRIHRSPQEWQFTVVWRPLCKRGQDMQAKYPAWSHPVLNRIRTLIIQTKKKKCDGFHPPPQCPHIVERNRGNVPIPLSNCSKCF